MKISVIGTGYVGLVTGACLSKLGNNVVCIDKNFKRIDPINNGKTPFFEPGLDAIVRNSVKNKKLQATSDLFASINQTDITFIAVGTPQKKNGDINTAEIKKASEIIGNAIKHKKNFHIVVVKSTVVPGTTEQIVEKTIKKIIKKKNNFGVCMNPEFLRQGFAVNDFLNPDRIVVGSNSKITMNIINKLYKNFKCNKVNTTIKNAELIKYASNSLLATMISFSNEISNICEKTEGTDVNTVLEGVHLDKRLTQRINNKYYSPGIISYLKAGCGFGGSCLPKDINALKIYANKKKIKTNLLEAVIKINNERTERLKNIIKNELGSIKKKNIAILGLAFKAGTDDLRDSPSIKILKKLTKLGANVKVWDPKININNNNYLKFSCKKYKNIYETIKNTDCIIIATDWPDIKKINWKKKGIIKNGCLLLDGRNLLKKSFIPNSIKYFNLGKG